LFLKIRWISLKVQKYFKSVILLCDFFIGLKLSDQWFFTFSLPRFPK